MKDEVHSFTPNEVDNTVSSSSGKIIMTPNYTPKLRSKTYNRISQQQRKQFLELVLERGYSIKDASEKSGIIYNTSKVILKVYLKDKRIGKKKYRSPKPAQKKAYFHQKQIQLIGNNNDNNCSNNFILKENSSQFTDLYSQHDNSTSQNQISQRFQVTYKPIEQQCQNVGKMVNFEEECYSVQSTNESNKPIEQQQNISKMVNFEEECTSVQSTNESDIQDVIRSSNIKKQQQSQIQDLNLDSCLSENCSSETVKRIMQMVVQQKINNDINQNLNQYLSKILNENLIKYQYC